MTNSAHNVTHCVMTHDSITTTINTASYSAPLLYIHTSPIRLSFIPIGIFTIDDLGQLQAAVWSARSQYYSLGTALGVSAGDLDAIEKSGFGQIDRCFTEMLKVCLKRERGLSQQELADALGSPAVGFGRLAQEIRSKTF